MAAKAKEEEHKNKQMYFDDSVEYEDDDLSSIIDYTNAATPNRNVGAKELARDRSAKKVRFVYYFFCFKIFFLNLFCYQL